MPTDLPVAITEAAHNAVYESVDGTARELAAEITSRGYLPTKTLRLALRLAADTALAVAAGPIREAERARLAELVDDWDHDCGEVACDHLEAASAISALITEGDR